MHHRLTVLIVATFALSGLAVGCGDDEERLSEEEFVEQANKICADRTAADEAAQEERFGDEESPPDAEVVDFIEDQILPSIEGQIEDLDDLAPPEELEDDVDDLLASAREDFEATEADVEAAISGEDDPFAETNEKAAALGLTECAG